MTAATHTETLFLHHVILPYKILSLFLRDNDQHFECKVSATLWRVLGVKHMTNTAYNHQTNKLVKIYNK